MADVIELFPFKHYDPVRKRWVKARYKARRGDIEKNFAHTQWEITGPPEIREVGRDPLTLTAGHLARSPFIEPYKQGQDDDGA